jgi:hypothetical protein
VDVIGRAGLVGVEIVAHFDCFRGTSKERVAKHYGVRGANLIARRTIQ